MALIFDRKTIWKEYGIILLIAIFGGFVRYHVWDFMGISLKMHMISAVFSFFLMVISWEYFRGINKYLDHVFPFERSISGRITIQLFLGVCFMLIIRAIVFAYAQRLMPNQFDQLFYLTTYAIFIIISFFINFIFFTVHFLSKWKESIVLAERLEKEKAQVQLHNLKNQLNPHFLFNSLSSLDSLISENQELASDFLQNLSKMYRYLLQNQDKKCVPLRSELDFIEKFIFLIKTRFDKAITFNLEVADTWLDHGIVPVSLQVLIENIVKHNVMDSDHPIAVSITNSGEYLVVTNTRCPRPVTDDSNGQGLTNLASFYLLLTDKQMEIEETESHFSVKLPLLQME